LLPQSNGAGIALHLFDNITLALKRAHSGSLLVFHFCHTRPNTFLLRRVGTVTGTRTSTRPDDITD
jgi:hypothetical protein